MEDLLSNEVLKMGDQRGISVNQWTTDTGTTPVEAEASGLGGSRREKERGLGSKSSEACRTLVSGTWGGGDRPLVRSLPFGVGGAKRSGAEAVTAPTQGDRQSNAP